MNAPDLTGPDVARLGALFVGLHADETAMLREALEAARPTSPSAVRARERLLASLQNASAKRREHLHPDQQGGPDDEGTNNALLWEAFTQLVFGMSLLGCPPEEMIEHVQRTAEILPEALEGLDDA